MDSDAHQFLKAAFQAVADAPLAGADPRYEPLGEAARGEDSIERLARGIEFSSGESIQLVTGFRGTGKTTELRRLEQRLVEHGYEVVFVDIEEHIGKTYSLVTDLVGMRDSLAERMRQRPSAVRKEVVLIVDSFEHVREARHARSIEDAVAILSGRHSDTIQIPWAHLVVTVPLPFKLRSMNAGIFRGLPAVEVIPAVRPRDVEGHRSWPGIMALKTLLEKRFDVGRLLGNEVSLERVILASGGNLRDLLRLAREIILRAISLPVEPQVVDAAIEALRAELLPLAERDLTPLAYIATHHEIAVDEPGRLPDLSRWSEAHLVLQYREGRDWYDVHPLVRDLVLDRAKHLTALPGPIHAEAPPPSPKGPASPRFSAARGAATTVTPQMRLAVIVDSYRALRRVRWTLPRGVSALVGPNGSGKTTLLDVPELLRHALQHDVTRAIDARGGPGNLRNARAERDAPVVLGVQIDDVAWQIDLSPKGGLAATPYGERASIGDTIAFDRSAPVPGLPLRADDSRPLLARYAELPEGAPLRPLTALLEGYRFYHAYDLAGIRLNGSQVSSDEHLHPDGRNVFSVLRNWRDRKETRPRWEFVISSLKAAFPDTFDDLDFEMAGQTVSGRITAPQPDVRVSTYFAANGWLVALLHLTAVASTGIAGAVAIDEIENGLHPYAIRHLIDAMRDWADQTGISVVLATHSPVVIDQFKEEPEHLFVMEPDREDAPTPLDELHDPEWLAHFSLGDLYAHDEFGAQTKGVARPA